MTRYPPKRAVPRLVSTFAVLAFAGALSSCGDDGWKPADLLSGGAPRQVSILKRGQEQYSLYCVGCHGESGDGNGPAARFLDPKPRDFRKGRVKFAAVPAGTLPRDEDLLHTMNHGLHGTSMASWQLIADEDKRAIVAYLKTFSDVWQKEAPGVPVALKPDPWRKKPERGIAEGERVYHGLAACSSCHPSYATKVAMVKHLESAGVAFAGFRADPYESVSKESDWGAPIKSPDFLVDRTKSATTKDELVRVIAAGVGGTAMPSWGESLTNQQLWGLAYYVESLIEKRGTPEGAALRQSLANQPPFTPPPPEPEPAATAGGAPSNNPASPPKDK